jgi:hypothetical protein
MARCGLNIIDVENLRMHYAYTLDRWAAAFERQVERIRRMFDERFVRMWRMYLHSSAATFRWGYLNLWQISFTKGLVNALPLTRDYIYAGEGSAKPALVACNRQNGIAPSSLVEATKCSRAHSVDTNITVTGH